MIKKIKTIYFIFIFEFGGHMKTENIVYEVKGKKYHGFLAYDDKIKVPRPGVLVAHAYWGKDEFVNDRAVELAKLGYIGFAGDVYGEGRVASTEEEAGQLVSGLFVDRQELRIRINANLDLLRNLPNVDKTRLGAIGFCFGGLTVLELLRSGADFKAGVSFHGVLGTKLGELRAKPAPEYPMKASMLFLHGNDDPLVSHQDITDLENELTKGKVDWEFNTYGNATHAFTNPKSQNPAHGMQYNEKVANRAYLAMKNFFAEKFAI
jgi:dienelactone hydrolase